MSASVARVPRSTPAPRARPVGQQRHVLAAVVGGGRGGVAAVVGGEDQRGRRRAARPRSRGSQASTCFERAGVALDVVAVAVQHVEIDQIDEDQAAVARRPCASRVFSMPSALVLVLSSVSRCRAPGRRRRSCRRWTPARRRFASASSSMPRGRRHGVVVAVGGARERAGRADERPRDHAPHFVRPAQDLARDLADAVQLGKRDHLFVRGDLEDAVGRGVDDGRARAHVLFAQFLDDLGARGRHVAQRLRGRCGARTRP